MVCVRAAVLLGLFFSNCNSCIGGFGPFVTLGDPFPRGPPRPSPPPPHLSNNLSSPAGHEYRKTNYGAALTWGCSSENRFVPKRWHPFLIRKTSRSPVNTHREVFCMVLTIICTLIGCRRAHKAMNHDGAAQRCGPGERHHACAGRGRS